MREPLFNHLRKNGIGVQVNYLPAYRHPVFKKLEIKHNKFINSEEFYESEISLPMYVDLQDSQIAKVAEVLHAFR